jgi:superfamily II DNA or RNA helicase
MGVVGRNEAQQAAKGFRYRKGSNGAFDRIPSLKPEFVAHLIQQEVKGRRQVLVWTLFDAETEILKENLRGLMCEAEYLTGKVKEADRPAIIERFRTGQTQVLVSRASMLGFGMNFQHCTAMIFSGFDDSYERYYQAIRRIYRYGQKEKVRIHIPYIKELEGVIWDNVQEKQAGWQRDTSLMEAEYIEAMKELLPI